MGLTGDQVLAVLALILGPSSVVGVVVKRWSDDRAVSKAAESLKEKETEANKALREAEVNKALASAWERLVDSAEKREAAANDRNDRAITSISGLTSALNDLTNINKLVLDAINDRPPRT